MRYPVEWVASEFGVDRKTLRRKLEAIGVDCSNGVTLNEAHEAETKRSESEEARRRKTIAEAKSAEIDAQLKEGKFMPRSLYIQVVSDLAAQTRVVIESARYISRELRMRLGKEIAVIEPLKPE